MCWLCNIKENPTHVLEQPQSPAPNLEENGRQYKPSCPSAAEAPAAGSTEDKHTGYFSLLIATPKFVGSTACNPKANTDALN